MKIDLHHQLLTWRREIAVHGHLPWTKRMAMKLARMVLRRPWLYRLSGKLSRGMLRWLPRFVIYNRLNTWGKQRDLPAAPKRSFREIWVGDQGMNGR